MPTVTIPIRLAATAVAGTVDAITATFSPTVTVLTDKSIFVFRATGANASPTPTFKADTTTAKTIVKENNQALVAGDIVGEHFIIYNSTLDKYVLMNPFYGGDSFWKAGAGTNSLMDKRSATSSGDNGFAAGVGAINTGDLGQAFGANSGNEAVQGQAFGHNAQNTGASGQAFGDNANNSGVEGQAVGTSTINTFARSSAFGHGSTTTAADQTNISKTVRFQEYTGAGIKLLQHDNDGIISGVTTLPATVTGTKSQVGLGNVDNTSDANKPVSTAQQTALDLKANLASPALTGNPTAPTQAAGDNSTKVATTAYVKTAIDQQPEVIAIACSDLTSNLTTGTSKGYIRMPFAMTLTSVRASVIDAPTGASLLTVDINEAGVTILSTKITIDASEKTSTTAATAPVISDSALADDAEITVDIDQIGSTNAGKGLIVYLIGTRT